MKRSELCSLVCGEVCGTNDPELLAVGSFLHNRYLLGQPPTGSMCDCMEYEYEEQTTETEAKEPMKIAVPVLVARSKKR